MESVLRKYSNVCSESSVCIVCKKKLKDRVITNGCLHKFCWDCSCSYMEATTIMNRFCPVCKKPFRVMSVLPVPDDNQWYFDGFRINWLRITTAFRKKIYTKNAWVLDLVDVSKKYEEFTLQTYRNNPSQAGRLSLWLRREVMVLLDHSRFEAPACDFVIQKILTMLHHHSIQSESFKAAVQPHFDKDTDHFIHEFYNFASSFYDIHKFDDNAFYYAYFSVNNQDQMLKMNVYLDYQEEVLGPPGTSVISIMLKHL